MGGKREPPDGRPWLHPMRLLLVMVLMALALALYVAVGIVLLWIALQFVSH